MSNVASDMSPKVMSFTDLLDEYIQGRRDVGSLSEKETHRLAEVTYEIDVRCPPKK